ncbi:DHA2 family lincomycin resistance protein-like MFS transporter [Kineococcus radiotolerans]|uniref:Drug resistance transporter, EmrB/QacA subfamily n=2 Tax=Kineococcus radiotolerans TaxID=131568 RepID=A6W4L9_KINRD|nr:MDR family MFS transporter [Kineococcus radiotolerans]ABS01758.1 drug resistance transporter, EmrB/QacA subfamily [Kineococcus radiotolerans SRS30216 = ATCC BAA-149]MBB2901101.1 DHA2 family lincomycin resistance protein-like MFS transporter [Kineococcus radiotolerans]
MSTNEDTTLPAPPPAAAPAAVPAERDRLAPGDGTVIALLLVSAFVVILNETIMGVALPRLMADLGITAATGQWLTTGFMLTMAVVIPATGFIMERFRLRQVFVAAMSLFSLGTAIAAVAPGFELLLVGRIVQASGTAVMMPLLMTTALTLVPAASRGRTMGMISVVISVAPAIGPTISGIILNSLSWRWMFIIVLPIALIALGLGTWKVRNVTAPRHARLDVLSLLLSAVGFGGLIYGLSSLGESATGHAPVAPWVPVLVGVLALAAFVRRQFGLQRTSGALMDLRVFANRSFTVSTIVLVTSFMGLFGTLIVLPIFLQTVLELGSLETGLLLLPGGAAMGVLSPVVGRLFDRYGPRPLVTPGAVLVSGALWLLTTLHAGTPAGMVVAVHTLLSVGLAFMFTPLFTSALGSLRAELYGHGSAIVGTVQQLAGAAGTALFVTVLSTTSADSLAGGATALHATADGVRSAFVWGGVISLVALALSLLVRRPPLVPGPRTPVH